MQPKTRSGQGHKQNGVGWVTVGTAHARPLPARLHDSDTQRSCAGTPGIGPTTLYSPGGPTRSGRLCCQFFEPFGLSSRSCCSTGRLMRSLAPWWGDGRSEASSFFPLGDTTRSSGFFKSGDTLTAVTL